MHRFNVGYVHYGGGFDLLGVSRGFRMSWPGAILLMQADALTLRCRGPFSWVTLGVPYDEISEAYPLTGFWAPGVGLQHDDGAEIQVFTTWKRQQLLDALAAHGVPIA
jgi:hypothetical protein